MAANEQNVSSSPRPLIPANYRLWVNEERTVLVRLWADDKTVEVATRESPAHTWGPPIMLDEE